MKIVCDGCGARYSIAEEKIGSRAFRFRCKRCGQTMVVAAAVAHPAARCTPETDPRPDLFAPPSGEDDVACPPAPAPMTGVRSESSVLFSLDNLQALAMRGERAPVHRSQAEGAAAGSGLLDLRALQATAGPPVARAVRGADDLLGIGGSAAFSHPLGASALVPQPVGSPALLRMLVAVAALLLVGVVGLIVLLVGRPAQARTALAPLPAATQLAPLPRLEPPPPSPVAAPNAPSPVAVAPSEIDAPAIPRDPAQRPRDPRPPRDGVDPPRESPPPSESRAPGHGRSIEDLVREAVGPDGGVQAPIVPPPPPRPPALPAQPSRADVRSALSAMQGPVRACALPGQAGTADIRVVFAPTGRVTTATVASPPFAGTPAGSCMARAAREARLPPFSGGNLAVTFPFVVR